MVPTVKLEWGSMVSANPYGSSDERLLPEPQQMPNSLEIRRRSRLVTHAAIPVRVPLVAWSKFLRGSRRR